MSASLEKKKQKDPRTGVKRSWMNYSDAVKWLEVGKGKADYAPYIVVILSLLVAIALLAVAAINHASDQETLIRDGDGDKQFDNPWVTNDGVLTLNPKILFGISIFTNNETADADPLVSSFDEEKDPAAWFREYPEISALDYIIFSGIAIMFPYGYFAYRRDMQRTRIEAKFPDFLRDLAEFWKGGLSMNTAVETLAKGEYGFLNDEVHKMSTQLSWGVSFGEVMEMFSERVSSPVVTRAVRMVDEANKAGGKISDILLAASYDVREIKALETERGQEIGSYLAVIYMSYVIYLLIIIVLVATFVPAIVSSGAATASTGSLTIGNLKIRSLNQIWISTTFYYSVLIQAVGMGMTGGFMATGKLYSGFIRSSLLILIGWAVFEIMGITTSIISPPNT
ncbi:MAG: hypothetical protein BEU04_01585 [Marine Group III euryarchaeote CG-Bathy1]|uniref:Type II secretion system protein GspF domain-containing protein n=1 Tax=Marine Group III euryarchaeote CG-Bathy1 TaxID=1889001 RepID=A0A1J5TSE9_9ARCH|nr:MAG: hypothetical protein BEU04_01585 [Marine Group III euryarchaeote CG-Bathy1]